MRLFVVAAVCAVAVLGSATQAAAQNWTGVYVGGSIGAGFQKKNASETVRFDTNLDGTFTDTVRTVAGADAFSTGFCGGLAVGAMASAGCTDDEDGIDFGGRLGYDRQFGRVVVGGLVDVSRTDVIDSVTAFSITPAFYSFTREVNYVAGLRGRIGFGNDRVLVYGTGGPAWGNIDQRFTSSNLVNTFVPTDDGDDDDDDNDEGSSESVWGYQAGGGLEFRFGRRWSLTGEYLFTSLDNREESGIRSQGPAPVTNAFILVNPGGTDFQRSEKFEFQAVRFGLNYRF
ncbi:MAG: porin family protein [Acidobacteria bacterium]|nr:porin family protein [Acidobacteriota bacterium]